MLEGTGAIRASRGHITMPDREKLEHLAGQSSGFAEKEYSNVFVLPINEVGEVDLRYFMNIRYRGRIMPDYEGDELPVEEAVRDHALAIARDLVFGTRMDTVRSWFDCSFEVTDQSGESFSSCRLPRWLVTLI
jgi:hypothetical protein